MVEYKSYLAVGLSPDLGCLRQLHETARSCRLQSKNFITNSDATQVIFEAPAYELRTLLAKLRTESAFNVGDIQIGSFPESRRLKSKSIPDYLVSPPRRMHSQTPCILNTPPTSGGSE